MTFAFTKLHKTLSALSGCFIYIVIYVLYISFYRPLLLSFITSSSSDLNPDHRTHLISFTGCKGDEMGPYVYFFLNRLGNRNNGNCSFSVMRVERLGWSSPRSRNHQNHQKAGNCCLISEPLVTAQESYVLKAPAREAVAQIAAVITC